LFKAVKFVKQGEMGVRTSFGRATYAEDNKDLAKRGQPYGVVGRGPHLVWPFTHSIVIVNVKDRTHALPVILPDTDKGRQFRFNSELTWAVSPDGDNPVKAYFNVETPEQLAPTVISKTADGLRYVLNNMSSQNMQDKELVEAGLFAHTGGLLLDEYGVVMKSLNVINSTRSDIDRLTESIAQSSRQMAPVLGGLAATGVLERPEFEDAFGGGLRSVEADPALVAAMLSHEPNIGYL